MNKMEKRKYSIHVSKVLVLLFPQSNGLELFCGFQNTNNESC